MKIEANDKEIQDIFSLGYFKIPRFQRPYSWEDDEVTNFWTDVIKQSGVNYFISSMVVYQTKKPYFGIVDGQQRLTTITLMLAAVRNAFITLNELNLAKGVHGFIERKNIDNEDEFILNSETSFPYLQDHIQSFNGFNIPCDVGTEELNLKSAFEYITQKLSEEISNVRHSNQSNQLQLFSDDNKHAIEKLKIIRDKILSLKLVFIQLDNEDDAYLIFETLNARGRDLTTSDLVKNLLLKNLKSNHSHLDAAKISWNGIVKMFDNAGVRGSLDPFLYHFWLSQHEYTTEQKLFSKIKAHIEKGTTANLILKSVEENANYYLSIISPDSCNWTTEQQDIKRSFEALLQFNVRQHLPMTLSLMRAYRQRRITLKMLRKTLEKIEYFHYIFNGITSQRSSGSVSTHYSKYGIALSEAKNHSEIQASIYEMIEGLKRKKPGFDEFKTNFLDLAYTSRSTKAKGLVKYTLRKLMGDKLSGVSIDFDRMTIEHILPEAKGANESSLLLIGNIGNLILVDKDTNSRDLVDLPFNQKKAILLKVIPICFVKLRFNALERAKRGMSEIMCGSDFTAL